MQHRDNWGRFASSENEVARNERRDESDHHEAIARHLEQQDQAEYRKRDKSLARKTAYTIWFQDGALIHRLGYCKPSGYHGTASHVMGATIGEALKDLQGLAQLAGWDCENLRVRCVETRKDLV